MIARFPQHRQELASDRRAAWAHDALCADPKDVVELRSETRRRSRHNPKGSARMPKRTIGKSKLSPEMRQRLAEVAAEARRLVYGEKGCPEWGTSFAEIESDAREVGHEFI